MIEEYKIDTGSGRIAIKDNRGGVIPVVLVHGSSFSKDVFAKQFADPALADFRLIALDLPGHGQSDDAKIPETAYTISGFAGAVSSVIEELGLVNCIVAGWSLGGHVAIELLGAHCAVAGAATIGTPPLSRGSLGMIRGFHFTFDMLLASKAQMQPHEAARFEKLTLGSGASGEFVDTILRTDPRMRPTVARSMFSGKGCDQRETVLSSTVPVCLIQGENDPLVRTGYVRSLQSDALYEGRCQVIAGAGHAPFMEKPSEFNALLAKFAGDVGTGAAFATSQPNRLPWKMAG